MCRILDRNGWLLASAVALPTFAAGIYVGWFGPSWVVAWWRGVLYVLAAAVIASALLGIYLRQDKGRQ